MPSDLTEFSISIDSLALFGVFLIRSHFCMFTIRTSGCPLRIFLGFFLTMLPIVGKVCGFYQFSISGVSELGFVGQFHMVSSLVVN